MYFIIANNTAIMITIFNLFLFDGTGFGIVCTVIGPKFLGPGIFFMKFNESCKS